MNTLRFGAVWVVLALLTAACASDMRNLLSEEGPRGRAIETLLGDAAMRGEVVDRLLGTPAHRDALFRRILENEGAAGALVRGMLETDRGMAVVASQVAAERQFTRSFMTMLMSTGALGEILTQEQAELLHLGEAFAHGNQRRTMIDLKRLGDRIDAWARGNEGTYPACDSDDEASDCLASTLPADVLTDLRLTDAWGRPFQYQTDERGRSYLLVSYATDGLYDRLGKVGPTSSYDADIVFSDGDFVQWPGHIRKEAIR